ncbi:hypothetical protein [Chamaesiphon sp. OTE_20_metabat_361]|uniref:hypothetical protein n=1 Tax=Chamaesiphon sp. OTE_20_metabat_361 TaxID=2964689 RepID=UPI00286BE295|nr:hypothetical protein [Chamaesiphon sp. OTE_20_metabat_361]
MHKVLLRSSEVWTQPQRLETAARSAKSAFGNASRTVAGKESVAAHLVGQQL